MRVDSFSYELPPERIAQLPSDDREAARLMVLLGGGERRARRRWAISRRSCLAERSSS